MSKDSESSDPDHPNLSEEFKVGDVIFPVEYSTEEVVPPRLAEEPPSFLDFFWNGGGRLAVTIRIKRIPYSYEVRGLCVAALLGVLAAIPLGGLLWLTL